MKTPVLTARPPAPLAAAAARQPLKALKRSAAPLPKPSSKSCARPPRTHCRWYLKPRKNCWRSGWKPGRPRPTPPLSQLPRPVTKPIASASSPTLHWPTRRPQPPSLNFRTASIPARKPPALRPGQRLRPGKLRPPGPNRRCWSCSPRGTPNCRLSSSALPPYRLWAQHWKRPGQLPAWVIPEPRWPQLRRRSKPTHNIRAPPRPWPATGKLTSMPGSAAP